MSDTTIVTTATPDAGNPDFAAGVAAATAITAASEAAEAEQTAENAESVAETAVSVANQAAETAAGASVEAAVADARAQALETRLDVLEAAVTQLGGHVGLVPADGTEGDQLEDAEDVDVVIEGDSNSVTVDQDKDQGDKPKREHRKSGGFWGSRL